MISVWYVLAIVAMVIGHIAKTKRWGQFINVYEQIDKSVFLKILSVSHAINVVLPFRVGDILRIYSASKKLKNSYTLAIATVIVDLYLDVLTVGIIFQGLSLWGNEQLIGVAQIYMLIMTSVLVITLLGGVFKKRLKKGIQWIAAVFNEKIELQLMYVSYTVIASFKDIVKKLNKKKFCLFTMEMWSMYLLSYFFFAKAMAERGFDYGLADVFAFVFSKNCTNVLMSYGINGVTLYDLEYVISVMIYMIIPLFIVWLYSEVYKKLFARGIENSYLAKSILPHLSANDKLAFLEMYFADENIDNIENFLNVNQDINILRDLSAGSNATTVLAVNSENQLLYRKYAFAQETQKLREQCKWLEEHQDSLPVAKIDRVNDGKDYFSYDMRYQVGASVFFDYIHFMPKETAWNVLKSVLVTLQKELYTLNNSLATANEVLEYIDEKVTKNLNVIRNGGKYIKNLLEYNTIVINGVQYHNLAFYEKFLRPERLSKVFANSKVADIHGDLTIENIICCESEEKAGFYIIDPNTGNKLNTPFLDYAKLLQSLHGDYEFLMLVKNVSIEQNRIKFSIAKSQNYAYLYQKYDELLHEMYSVEEVKSIYYHEIVHWLRLMPYKIRKNEKTAVVFYCGLIMVLDDIMKRFEG